MITGGFMNRWAPTRLGFNGSQADDDLFGMGRIPASAVAAGAAGFIWTLAFRTTLRDMGIDPIALTFALSVGSVITSEILDGPTKKIFPVAAGFLLGGGMVGVLEIMKILPKSTPKPAESPK